MNPELQNQVSGTHFQRQFILAPKVVLMEAHIAYDLDDFANVACVMARNLDGLMNNIQGKKRSGNTTHKKRKLKKEQNLHIFPKKSHLS